MRRYTDDELGTILDGLRSRGVFRERDLLALGLRRSSIQTMVHRQGLRCIGRGLYTSRRCDETPLRGFAVVAARVPNATICLASALRFHGLVDEAPRETWIAVPRGAWIPVVRDLPVRVIQVSGLAATLDVEVHDVEGVPVRVFGAAKSVVDCLRFRAAVGEGVAAAALRRLMERDPSARGRIEELAVKCRAAGALRRHLGE